MICFKLWKKSLRIGVIILICLWPSNFVWSSTPRQIVSNCFIQDYKAPFIGRSLLDHCSWLMPIKYLITYNCNKQWMHYILWAKVQFESSIWKNKIHFLLTKIQVLRFLPTIPLPGGGIPPRIGDLSNMRIELISW